MAKKTDESYTDEETEQRREAALKRMLATPHKPHKPHKLAKSKKANPSKERGRPKIKDS